MNDLKKSGHQENLKKLTNRIQRANINQNRHQKRINQLLKVKTVRPKKATKN